MVGCRPRGTRIAGLWWAGLLFAAVGCAPTTADSITKRYTALLNKVSDRLDRVQSTQDADAAAADIQKLLKQSDAIAKSARSVSPKSKPTDATKDKAKEASSRFAASLARVRDGNLRTPALDAALDQVRLSFDTLATAAAAGGSAAPETPLEEAWVDWIDLMDEQSDLLATLSTEADVERAMSTMIDQRVKRYKLLVRIAEAGGRMPPSGVPKKYAKLQRAAEQRLAEQETALNNRIGSEALSRLSDKLESAVAAHPELTKNPLDLFANNRPKQLTVLIRNADMIQGDLHRQAVERLKEVSGATKAESIVGEDGKQRIVLSPVAEFTSFMHNIKFGKVVEFDLNENTFTLMVDPKRLSVDSSSAAGGSGTLGQSSPRPGFPPPGAFGAGQGPRPGADFGQQMVDQFFARTGGREKGAVLVLENATKVGSPEDNALIKTAKQAAGARSSSRIHRGGDFLLLAPVDDFEGFAANINFGTVTSKDPATREIHVTVDPSKLTP